VALVRASWVFCMSVGKPAFALGSFTPWNCTTSPTRIYVLNLNRYVVARSATPMICTPENCWRDPDLSDPIVDEVRAIREAYAASSTTTSTILADLCSRQAQHPIVLCHWPRPVDK